MVGQEAPEVTCINIPSLTFPQQAGGRQSTSWAGCIGKNIQHSPFSSICLSCHLCSLKCMLLCPDPPFQSLPAHAPLNIFILVQQSLLIDTSSFSISAQLICGAEVICVHQRSKGGRSLLCIHDGKLLGIAGTCELVPSVCRTTVSQ